MEASVTTNEITAEPAANQMQLSNEYASSRFSLAVAEKVGNRSQEGSESRDVVDHWGQSVLQLSIVGLGGSRGSFGNFSIASELLSLGDRNEEEQSVMQQRAPLTNPVGEVVHATSGARGFAFSPVQRIPSGVSQRNEASIGYNDDISRSSSCSSGSEVMRQEMRRGGVQRTEVKLHLSHSNADVDAEEEDISTIRATPTGGAVDTLNELYGIDRYFTFHYNPERVVTPIDCGDQCSGGGSGVSTVATAAGLESQRESDDNRVAMTHEEDEIVGVTAEGEFIYRRDIVEGPDRQRWQSFYQPINRRSSELGVNECVPSLIPSMTINSAPTRVESGPATTTEPYPQDQYNNRFHPLQSFERVATQLPHLSREAPHEGFTERESEWTEEERESYRLLMRYRLCENEEEFEYEKLLNSVSTLRETLHRKPIEMLQRRLEERQQFARSGLGMPLALRW
ncbi:uncharacterized protein TEOVI_000785900 [Trypanosoma equiperdum]|uniref:Uncharacterized protein n=1 Tax=Trypanosoma equiperdum TaxID=5694 RepID=A0A1G4I7G2_TRYEQ|nr:hypothetical protein, conserved [Trypanosoma equiperdum]